MNNISIYKVLIIYCFFLNSKTSHGQCPLTLIDASAGYDCPYGQVVYRIDNNCPTNGVFWEEIGTGNAHFTSIYDNGTIRRLSFGPFEIGTSHTVYIIWQHPYPSYEADTTIVSFTIPPGTVSSATFNISDIIQPKSPNCNSGSFIFNRQYYLHYDCNSYYAWNIDLVRTDPNSNQTTLNYTGSSMGDFPYQFYCLDPGIYNLQFSDNVGSTFDTTFAIISPSQPSGTCNAHIVVDPDYTYNPMLSCNDGNIEFQYFDDLDLPYNGCCYNPWKAVITGPNGYIDSLKSNDVGYYEDFYGLTAGTYTITASRFGCTATTTVTLVSDQPQCNGSYSIGSPLPDSIGKGCTEIILVNKNFGDDYSCLVNWGYSIVDNLDSVWFSNQYNITYNSSYTYVPIPPLPDFSRNYYMKPYYTVDTLKCNTPQITLPHIYEKKCNLQSNAYIYSPISSLGNDGVILVSANSNDCLVDSLHAYIFTGNIEDGHGTLNTLDPGNSATLLDSLSAGIYYIKTWYADTSCNRILGPFELVGPESVVKNISINTTIGSLVYSPFDGVVVYAYHGADAEDSTITDANGHFTFSNLDENLFYTLKFYFQDSAGAANDLFLEYEYTGYKPGDAVGEILMPYTMLKQTIAVLDTLRSKGNYNIQYQFGPIDAADVGIPLNDLLAQQRAMYNVSSIDSLLNDWRTIDKVEAQVVIDNLGRTYIAMAAHNEFEKDAIELSKIPPKALFEIVLMALSVGDMAEKFSEFVYPSGLTKLIKSTAKSFLTFSLENLTSVLEKSIEPLPSSDDKVLMQRIIKALKLSTIALNKVKIPGTKDVIKMAKGVLNDQMFILLHEHYISHTQLLIDNLYNKAKLVVPPDGVFHEAYSQVLLANNLSIVDSAHAKTEHALDLCNTLFDNNEKLDAVTNVLNLVVDARAITGNSVAMDNRVKFLRKVTFLFDVFNAANITGALYTGWLRYMENMVEQVGVNTEAYSPGIAQNRNRGITSLSNTNLRTINTTSLCNSISKYNTKLDSILLLIQNSHSAEAVETTVELNTLSQSIDSMINYSTTGISAIAYEADSVIIGFDSIYTALMNTCNHTYFQRTGVTFNLTSWFLDTSGTSYIDTLIIIGNKAKLANLEVCAAFDVMDSITAGITTPVRVMITAIDGPKNTLIGDSSIVHIHYRNFGNMLAENAYVKINIDNSYSISQDSIYIGNISGNSSGEINFELYSPLIDTFSVYTVSLYVENGKGNLSSNYIITDSLELCNGIDDNHDGKTDEGCTITLNLKTFIQGFYLGNNTLMPVLDPINQPLICDSIIVELHDTFPEHNLIASCAGIISTIGVGLFEFPRELFEHAYYIVVRHRNSIETWSKSPVVFGMNTNFDFTTTE